MVLNHSGDPLGSILGPMGSYWVQKMGQNRKKLPCLKIRIFDYPAVIDFGQNSTSWLWRQITVGTPWSPSWGRWGPIGSKKWDKTVTNYHAPKFEFSTVKDFEQNSTLYLWRKITVWTPQGPCWGQWGPVG